MCHIHTVVCVGDQVEAQSVQEQQQQFDWAKNWYPLSPEEYLDPAKPHALTLLGKQLAVWQDSDGDWHACQDKCPHRCEPPSTLAGGVT